MTNMRTLIIIFLLTNRLLSGQNPLDRLLKDEPNGESIIKFSNGKTHEKFTKVNGHVHGYAYEYYENGQLKNISKLDNGKFIDTAISYYENGKIRTLDIYKHDTIHYSEINFYNKDGSPSWLNKYYLKDLNINISDTEQSYYSIFGFSHVSFNRFKFAKIPGCIYKEFTFDKKGKPFQVITRFSNKKHGEQLYWDKKGNLTKAYYKDGEKIANP